MELKGKHVLVVGLGESGLAMAKWLHRQGAFVRVADSRDNPPNLEGLARVAPSAEVIAGPFAAATFAGIDLVALSPGVPKATPAIAAVDVPVISEIELFAAGVREQAPGSKIIAITGSNGKTTTTALTAHLLNGAGVPAIACGNISPSALDALMDALDAGALPQIWVVELSSFQLETTHHLNADAATVLNISEDHLDRYDGELANYAAAKSRVFQGKGVMVLNRDDDWSMANGRCGRTMVTFGLNPAPRAVDYGLAGGAICRGHEVLVAVNALKLSGLHNAANAMAALALCEAVGVAPARLVAPLTSFAGLPHRVEPVAEIAGVRYIDDSKGTNVGATLAAIEGMGRKVAIVLGGEGKGQDFSPLLPALEKHGRAVALIGRDAAAIGAAICRLRPAGAALRRHGRSRSLAGRPGRGRRLRAAVAGLRQPRHVPQLRAAGRGVHRCGEGVAGMMINALDAPRRQLPEIDYALLWSVLLLLFTGMVMVYSASIAIAEAGRTTGYQPTYYLWRHLAFLVIGLMAAGIAFQIPLSLWQRYAPDSIHDRRRAARHRADSRHRARCQRRAALDAARHRQPAAVRADEAVRRALYRRLHGAQDQRHARPQAGLPADVRRHGRGRHAAAQGARLRRLRRDHRDRHGHPVPRRPQGAPVRAADRRVAGRPSPC